MKTEQNNNRSGNTDIAWVLVSLLQRNRLSIDRERLRQQLSCLNDLIGLPGAARALGLDVTFKCVTPQELYWLRLPAVAFRHVSDQSAEQIERVTSIPANGSTGVAAMVTVANSPQHNKRPCLLLHADEDRVAYIEAGSQIPVVTSVSEFGKRFTGQVILARPKSQLPASSRNLISRPKAGHEDLVSERITEDRIRRNWLIASLTVWSVDLRAQLMALTALCRTIDNLTGELPSTPA